MVATVCIAVMSRPVGAAGGKDGIVTWGAGIKDDIIDASVYALISAINRTGVL